MDLSLEDFLPEYPDFRDEDIQSKLDSYYEFREVEVKRKDRKLPGSTNFVHQDMYQRAAFFIPRLLLVGEAGIGKTRSLIALRKFLKANDPWMRRAYFITGPSQIEDFKSQVVYGKTFDSKNSDKKLTRKISKMVNKNYFVLSYDALHKKMLGIVEGHSVEDGNQLLQDYFSDSLFFFDEIQFLKISNTSGTTEEGVFKSRERSLKYWMLWRLCHVVERSRITISSATPHSNEVEEFGYVANLLLPLDHQMEIDGSFYEEHYPSHELNIKYGPIVNWDINQIKEDYDRPEQYYAEAFSPYLTGMMIYIAAPDIGVDVSYVPLLEENADKFWKKGIEIFRRFGEEGGDLSRLRILELEDGGIQMKSYLNFKKTDKSVAQMSELSILSGVFPFKQGVKNWGTKAFHYWIEESKSEKGWYSINEDILDDSGKTLSYYYKNYLKTLSAKMYYARYGCVNFPGKVYAFFKEVHTPGGVFSFGLALEHGGPVEGTGKSFQRYKYRGGGVSFSQVKEGELLKHVQKAPRYAIIYGGQAVPEKNRILDLYNHPDNIMGEYLKVIIISKSGQTGINLFSVSRTYSFYTSHNPVDSYQALYRFLRAVSHVDLLKLYEQMGKKLVIEVNLLSIVLPKEEGRDDNSTTDIQIYRRTRERDVNRLIISRAIKILSVTGYITRERNRIPDKFAMEQECDYMSCDFELMSDVVYPLEYNNYISLYSEIPVSLEIKKIEELLRKTCSLNIADYIYESSRGLKSKEIKEIICNLAVASICENKEILLDKYGYPALVVEKNGILYFVRGNVKDSQFFSEYYTKNLIGVKHETLHSINLRNDYRNSVHFFDDLAKTTTTEEMADLFGQEELEMRAVIVERFVKEYLVQKKEKFTPCQLSNFYETLELGSCSGVLLKTYQQITAIERVAGSRDGKLHDDDLLELEKEEIPENFIFLHNVYTTDIKRTKSCQAQKQRNVEGLLRCFLLKEMEWRDCNPQESVVYRRLFQKRIQVLEEQISDKFSIYGIMSMESDGLKIKDNKDSILREKTGCVCHQIVQKKHITEIMLEIGMQDVEEYQDISELEKLDMRNAMCRYRRKSEKMEGEENKLYQLLEVDSKEWYFDIMELREELFKSQETRNNEYSIKNIAREFLKGDPEDEYKELYDYWAKGVIGERIKDLVRSKTKYKYRTLNRFLDGEINGSSEIKSIVEEKLRELDGKIKSSKEYLGNGFKMKQLTAYQMEYLELVIKDKLLKIPESSKIRLATDEMVQFVYPYLMGPQSEKGGWSKTSMCDKIAVYMYERGMISAPDMNENQLKLRIQYLKTNR